MGYIHWVFGQGHSRNSNTKDYNTFTTENGEIKFIPTEKFLPSSLYFIVLEGATRLWRVKLLETLYITTMVCLERYNHMCI